MENIYEIKIENDISKLEEGINTIEFFYNCRNCFSNETRINKEAEGFNKNDFDRLLIKTDLEIFTEKLWVLGLGTKMTYPFIENTKMIDKQIKDYYSELIKTLLFLMENDNIKVKLSSTKSFINIENLKIIDLIKKCLLSEFKDNKLNMIPMRYETGKELLESGNEKYFIRQYYRDLEDNLDLSPEEKINFDIEDIEIDDDMIEYFIEGNLETIENVNIEFLKWKLKDFENPKEKGAPIKNYHLAFLLKKMLPLFNRQPSNKDFRLIFDYCKFFDIIPPEITSGYQYIKSIYQKHKTLILK